MSIAPCQKWFRFGAVSNRQKFFRIVGAIAGLILVAAWFYVVALDNAYVNHPRQAQPEAGLVVPYDVKGITVYITRRDRDLLTWLTRIGIVSGVFLMVGFIGSGDAIRKLRGD